VVLKELCLTIATEQVLLTSELAVNLNFRFTKLNYLRPDFTIYLLTLSYSLMSLLFDQSFCIERFIIAQLFKEIRFLLNLWFLQLNFRVLLLKLLAFKSLLESIKLTLFSRNEGRYLLVFRIDDLIRNWGRSHLRSAAFLIFLDHIWY